MSYVCLIAADKPLPLCDRQEERSSTVTVNGKTDTISFLRGFQIAEHTYYRHAVDMLGYSMKPHQYELSLEVHEEDLTNPRLYLTENFTVGETVELWNLWVGFDRDPRVPHYRGRLADLDLDTLEQLLNPPIQNGAPGQCRMTVVI